MHLCDADECTCCSLADRPDMAPCLRQKAQSCMRLATRLGREAGAALEMLSLELMEEARGLEREYAIPAAD